MAIPEIEGDRHTSGAPRSGSSNIMIAGGNHTITNCSRRRKLEQFPDFLKENKTMITYCDVVLLRKTTGGTQGPALRSQNEALSYAI